MDIQTSKIELVKLILNIENPSVIQKLKELIQRDTSDFGKELSKNENTEIEIALSQLNKGKKTSFDDFLKKVS